jgi:hypothetical protein
LKLKEVLLGFVVVDSSHSEWNLAQIVEKILLKHNLTNLLLAITADNASNNTTLRQSLKEALQSRSINWNVNAMTVNCLAHVLNLSAKSMLQGLGTYFYMESESEDLDYGLENCSVHLAASEDDELLNEGLQQSGEVGDTVQKASFSSHYRFIKVMLISCRCVSWPRC